MKCNLTGWHEFEHSERNSAESRVTPTGSIEVFHRSLIKCYYDVEMFYAKIQLQDFDPREISRQFLSIFNELNTLMQKSDVHYWLARAYAERHPGKSRDGLFVSFHFCALENAWRVFGYSVHAIHCWAVVECIDPDQPAVKNSGIDAVAVLSRRTKDILPELDERYLRKLQSEVKLACELLGVFGEAGLQRKYHQVVDA